MSVASVMTWSKTREPVRRIQLDTPTLESTGSRLQELVMKHECCGAPWRRRVAPLLTLAHLDGIGERHPGRHSRFGALDPSVLN